MKARIIIRIDRRRMAAAMAGIGETFGGLMLIFFPLYLFGFLLG